MRQGVALALLAAFAFVLPLACIAQPHGPKVARIGVLSPNSGPATRLRVEAMLERLRALGHAEGKTFRIDMRSSEGDYGRLKPLAQELVNSKVDLIIAAGTPAAQAVKAATRTIPVVMVAVGDPVASGLVPSLARPGGNLTGSSNLSPELMKKRVELLAEAQPGLRKVAVLVNPANPAQDISFEAIRAVAASLKVEPLRFEARDAEAIRKAFASMAQHGAQAVVVANDTLLLSNSRMIGELALKYRLASAGDRALVEAGGLIGYGSGEDVWRHSATYVDKILKGAKPADLPIEQPDTIALVVNLGAAKALGLALPQAFRLRIDKVIE